MARNFGGSSSHGGLAIVLVLPEPIFAIKGDWFVLLGINFCDFQKVPDKSLIKIIDNISFLSRTCKGNTYFLYYGVCTPCKTSKTDCFSLSFILIVLFLNKIPVVIEQTGFISTVILCSEFKLENIYSGVNFIGKIGNIFIYIYIADRWKNRKN